MDTLITEAHHVRVHGCFVPPVGFDKHVTCTHHCSILQNSSTALKTPLCSASSSFPPTLSHHWPFIVSMVSPFPECPMVGITQYVAFWLTQKVLSNYGDWMIGFVCKVSYIYGSFMSFHEIITLPFLLNNPLSGWTTIYLSSTCLGILWLLPGFGNYE